MPLYERWMFRNHKHTRWRRYSVPRTFKPSDGTMLTNDRKLSKLPKIIQMYVTTSIVQNRNTGRKKGSGDIRNNEKG